MEDRLSPSSSDSELHSLSQKTPFKRPGSRQRSPKLDEEPCPKRPRKGEDARVPASRESSEETASSDDCRKGNRKRLLNLNFVAFCQPSTSSSYLDEDLADIESEFEDELQFAFEKSPSPSNEDGQKENLLCLWEDCDQPIYSNINLLFDHVKEDHIKPLLIEDKRDNEEIECLWDDCQMSIARGDWSKKISWLEKHFHQRHARYAQSEKCVLEDCTFRCSNIAKLEEHVKKNHLSVTKNPTPEDNDLLEKMNINVSSNKKDEEEDNIIQIRGPEFQQNEFIWNGCYEKKIVEKNREMLGWKGEWISVKKPEKGSKHRKTYSSYASEFVAAIPSPLLAKKEERSEEFEGQLDEESEEPDEEDNLKKVKNMTLEDLFPGWNHKPLLPTEMPSTNKDEDIPMAENISLVEDNKRIEDDDIPVLEKISPLSELDPSDDLTPPLLSPMTSRHSSPFDEKMPCLERITPSDIEEEP